MAVEPCRQSRITDHAVLLLQDPLSADHAVERVHSQPEVAVEGELDIGGNAGVLDLAQRGQVPLRVG